MNQVRIKTLDGEVLQTLWRVKAAWARIIWPCIESCTMCITVQQLMEHHVG